WQVPKTGEWWQETWFGTRPQIRSLGVLDSSKGSIRSQIDRETSKYTIDSIAAGRDAAKEAGLTADIVLQATTQRAHHLQAQIDACRGEGRKQRGPRRAGAVARPPAKEAVA